MKILAMQKVNSKQNIYFQTKRNKNIENDIHETINPIPYGTHKKVGVHTQSTEIHRDQVCIQYALDR